MSTRGADQNITSSFLISIKTKAPSLIYVGLAHQALIGRILQLHQDELNSRQIADICKAKRTINAVVDVQREAVSSP